MRAVILVAVLAAASATAHAHGGDETTAGRVEDASVVAPLAVAAILFTIGWLRLHARSKRGAQRLRRRARLYAAGWAALALALLSPLHVLAERSFTAHMLEHEALMLIAAPLLVLAEPLVVMLWAVPAPLRRRVGDALRSDALSATWAALTGATTATLLQAAALWLWHAPTLFDLALREPAWHAAQHLSFFVTALLFWRAMLVRRPGATVDGVAVLCLFTTSIVSGALGALMAFSTSPWYDGYARMALAAFGLTPAEDQQMAGLLMWVPGGLVHAGAALLLVRKALAPTPRVSEASHAG